MQDASFFGRWRFPLLQPIMWNVEDLTSVLQVVDAIERDHVTYSGDLGPLSAHLWALHALVEKSEASSSEWTSFVLVQLPQYAPDSWHVITSFLLQFFRWPELIDHYTRRQQDEVFLRDRETARLFLRAAEDDWDEGSFFRSVRPTDQA